MKIQNTLDREKLKCCNSLYTFRSMKHELWMRLTEQIWDAVEDRTDLL